MDDKIRRFTTRLSEAAPLAPELERRRSGDPGDSEDFRSHGRRRTACDMRTRTQSPSSGRICR